MLYNVKMVAGNRDGMRLYKIYQIIIRLHYQDDIYFTRPINIVEKISMSAV